MSSNELRYNRARSLATQLTLRVALLNMIALISILLVIGAGSIITLMAAHRDIQEESVTAARSFDLFMAEIVRDVEVSGHIITQQTDANDVLRDILNRNPAIYQLSYVTIDGEVLADRRRVGVAEETWLTEQPWLETVHQGQAYWSAIHTETYGVPFIDLAVPVYSHAEENNRLATDTLEGALIAQIDLTAFWNDVSTIRVGETGYAYLVDSDGTLLAYRDLTLVKANQRIQVLINQSPEEVVDDSQNIFTSVYRGLSDDYVVASASPMTIIPWVAVVEQPVSEALQGFYQTGVVSLLLLVLALLILYHIWRFTRAQIVAPLLSLRNSADLLRQGHLDHQVEVGGHTEDEIGLLAATFNQMVEAIQRRTNELVEANRRAEENTRLKSEFLSNVSHELRTPLNAIIGFTGIILEDVSGSIDPDAQYMLQRVEANSRRLLHLINEILDLSKIEAGRMDIVPAAFAPQSLADTCQNEMKVLAEQKHLEFIVQLDPGTPAALYGDERRIIQIISNLLSNAFKFTERGRVSLRVGWQETQLLIEVKDTGIGIPPHALDIIFDPFRQVDGSSRRIYGGTGLGLSIVRHLVSIMRGKISVESQVGSGSTFTVLLPLATAEQAEPITRILSQV